MSGGLHGGGIPFLAEQTIDEIAGSEKKLESLSFKAPKDFDLARTTLIRRDDNSESIFKSKRGSFRLDFDETAREFLNLSGRENVTKDNPKNIKESMAPPQPKPNLYFRIFNAEDCFQSLDSGLLEKIATNMQEPTGDSSLSNIPAIYTYFGQFIAHDLTHMKFTGTPGEEWSHRSHSFDLDSVFGDIPRAGCPSLNQSCLSNPQPNHLCIGSTTGGDYEDLPRSTQGAPCISDPRNGSNLAISQLYVAIVRFIWTLQKKNNFQDVETLQHTAARFIQSIVLHDYLPTVCNKDIVNDLIATGKRKLIFPEGVPPIFQLPAEFAIACFRFGHSMINANYPWRKNSENATLYHLLSFTHLGRGLNPHNRLPDSWVVDWDVFNKGLARPIDTGLTRSLHSLDREWFDCDSRAPLSRSNDLSFITLWRAQQTQLANAQQILDVLSDRGDPCISGARRVELFNGGDALSNGLTVDQRATLNCNTPLWLFVLKEAERSKDGKLGPVASRIIAETLHAAVEAAPDNILDNPLSLPAELGMVGGSKFSLSMMFDALKSVNQT